MPRRFAVLACAVMLIGSAGTSRAQTLAGTYSAPNQQGGTITLELKALTGGKISGTLSGNGNSFTLDGAMNGAMAEGTITGNGMKMFFGAQLAGEQLQFIMVEPDANGQPNFQRATPIQFKRGAAAPTPAPAPQGNPLAGGAGGGNPLARSTPADKYAGAWTSKDVKLSLNTAAAGYSGTLTHQGQNYPITLKADGPGLSGNFTAGGAAYPVLVKLEGNSLLLNTAGTTYMLARGGDAAGAATGGGQVTGANAQDAQMIRVLTANAWCSFSYSGSSGTYSSGGVSRSSKVFLNADGSVSSTSSSERTSSGVNGQAYVGNQGGNQGYWKFENGQFYLGQTREQMAPQTFKMTYNSNGYPIPVVNGTEYMICR